MERKDWFFLLMITGVSLFAILGVFSSLDDYCSVNGNVLLRNNSAWGCGRISALLNLTGSKYIYFNGNRILWNETRGNLTYLGLSSNYTDEKAQDAVGGILTNTNDIKLVYFDSVPSINSSLLPTGVTAGTYGNSSDYPQITVNAGGRITTASTIKLPRFFIMCFDNGAKSTTIDVTLQLEAVACSTTNCYEAAYTGTLSRLYATITVSAVTTNGAVEMVLRKGATKQEQVNITTLGTATYQVSSKNIDVSSFSTGDELNALVDFKTFVGTISAATICGEYQYG